MQSTRYSLNPLDLGKGLLIAFLTAFLTTITQWLNLGTFPTGEQFKIAAIAGAAAAIAYLVKNFFTDDIKTAENVLDKAAAKEQAKFEKSSAPKDLSL